MGGIRTKIHVPHLGGIEAAYQFAAEHDPKKPTVVLIHSFMTTGDLYQSQFTNKELTNAVNLIAIDLLGHGETRAKSENYTYWDMAIMNIQVMEALEIKKYFVLGTSQGGWIAARIALLAQNNVQGIIVLGSSMDWESPRTVELGCWNVGPIGDALVGGWTSKEAKPDFELDDNYCNMNVDLGMGKECDQKMRDFWVKTIKDSYLHDDGRKRARMAAINLRDRDGLHGRLFDIRCPVLWMHGTSDVVYSVANAEQEIKLFANSPDAKLEVIQGGNHFLSATNPQEVDAAMISFVKKHS